MTLKDSYDEIYSKIESLHPYEKQLAIRAFQLVMCARRPLTTEELLGGVSVDPSQDDIDIRTLEVPDIEETDILDFCQSLLVYQQHTDANGQEHKTCRVSHLSVIEYLETNHFGLLEAQCNVACATLKILKGFFKGYSREEPRGHHHEQGHIQLDPQDSYHAETIPKTLPKIIEGRLGPELIPYSRFVHYSIDWWWWHVVYIEREADSEIEARLYHHFTSFLGHPNQGSDAYNAWMHYTQAMEPRTDAHEFFTTCWMPLVINKRFTWKEPMRPLHLAGMLGLRNLMFAWWNDRNLDMDHTMRLVPVSRKDSYEQTTSPGLETLWPLVSMVALNPDTRLLEHLVLTRGLEYASLNQPDKHVVTPLWAAAISSDPSPLRFLLSRVSDVHLNGPQTSLWPLPLGAAVCYGTEEALRLLLQAGAKPNLSETETKRYPGRETFLGEAVSRRNLNVVKLLVEAGADVNADAGFQVGSALAAARTTEVQEFLISAGADVNKGLHGNFGSALEAVAYGMSLRHVRMLLRNGANPNMLSHSWYSTPLTAVVVSAVGVTSPWTNKWQQECYDKCLLLLEAGADVNTTYTSDAGYCSALDACFHLLFRIRTNRATEHFFLCYKWMNLLICHGAVWRGRIDDWKSMAGARVQSDLGWRVRPFAKAVSEFDFWDRLRNNNAAVAEDEKDMVLWQKSWAALLARYQSTAKERIIKRLTSRQVVEVH